MERLRAALRRWEEAGQHWRERLLTALMPLELGSHTVMRAMAVAIDARPLRPAGHKLSRRRQQGVQELLLESCEVLLASDVCAA